MHSDPTVISNVGEGSRAWEWVQVLRSLVAALCRDDRLGLLSSRAQVRDLGLGCVLRF
jgi:hypothetical protein